MLNPNISIQHGYRLIVLLAMVFYIFPSTNATIGHAQDWKKIDLEDLPVVMRPSVFALKKFEYEQKFVNYDLSAGLDSAITAATKELEIIRNQIKSTYIDERPPLSNFLMGSFDSDEAFYKIRVEVGFTRSYNGGTLIYGYRPGSSKGLYIVSPLDYSDLISDTVYDLGVGKMIDPIDNTTTYRAFTQREVEQIQSYAKLRWDEEKVALDLEILKRMKSRIYALTSKTGEYSTEAAIQGYNISSGQYVIRVISDGRRTSISEHDMNGETIKMLKEIKEETITTSKSLREEVAKAKNDHMESMKQK